MHLVGAKGRSREQVGQSRLQDRHGKRFADFLVQRCVGEPGDAEATLDDGVLVLRVDLRPKS